MDNNVPDGREIRVAWDQEGHMRMGKELHTVPDKCLREAAKELRAKEDVTIRWADKTAAFVLIRTEEYHHKLDEILADNSKFQRITKNPVDDSKCEAHRIIETVNAASNILHLLLIVGDYDLGYIHGDTTTHKPGNPLHPIISQIPAPTYQLVKKLNAILTPYVPDDHSLKSSAVFIGALKVTLPGGVIASMDVESLFTNVPVDEAIQIILDRVCRDDSMPPLNIPEHALRTLHRDHMYIQKDGVAMGSPLGVHFANFYMGAVERWVFVAIEKLSIYIRYIDNTFISASMVEEIEDLRQAFYNHSSLNFIIEHCRDRHLPFLHVLVGPQEECFITQVYTKPTSWACA
ncbi:uncharacterized protein [Macrobrachium rosenbergii]|uniref:uncharacterized protein n=1 Tax=Macrobrachium rosenbergii TaxID=79674 RepID=UPI0034D77406